MKPFLLLSFNVALHFFLSTSEAFAAACCGGGFAAPSIISGDEKAQFTSSYSFTDVVINTVDARGIWRKWDEKQSVMVMQLEGAHLVSDRWQVGAVVPVIQRSYMGQQYSGLGDVSVSLGYEYLTDWDYNPLKPKGIGFLQLTLPTGKSRAESEVGGLDSRGNGFWSIGAGTLLTKTLGAFDVFGLASLRHSFAKDTTNSYLQGTLHPGWGGSLGIGAGYNLKAFRVGTSLTWFYEDPIDIDGTTSYMGSVERYATAMFSVSYLSSTQWATTVSYLDQTLFGSPINTSLGRTVSVLIQKKWNR
ncbi:MAG: hypothetical protein M9899_10630 [Bdellovibrionaceae bacterium]|nr:hypothetical protein [Pseudobdellovibrionaceae bacterium]MCO5114611.1 hypothetical protein [Pseudobdellovibrionaceae bacterium]